MLFGHLVSVTQKAHCASDTKTKHCVSKMQSSINVEGGGSYSFRSALMGLLMSVEHRVYTRAVLISRSVLTLN
jgi:hypothetical protein